MDEWDAPSKSDNESDVSVAGTLDLENEALATEDQVDESPEREEGEIAEPKAPARISLSEYHERKAPPPDNESKPSSPPRPVPTPVVRASAMSGSSREGVDPNIFYRDPRDGQFEGDEYHALPSSDIRDRASAGLPPVNEPHPLPIQIWNDHQRLDFGVVGGPHTRPEVMAPIHLRHGTVKSLVARNAFRSEAMVGIPYVLRVGERTTEYDRRFWDWVARTKNVDVATMQALDSVGVVKKTRDMRFRYARLLLDKGGVDEDIILHDALRGRVHVDPPQPLRGSTSGTNAGDPARSHERDRHNPLEDGLRLPRNSGSWDTPATSQGAPGDPVIGGRPRSPPHGSGAHHGGHGPGVEHGSAGWPLASHAPASSVETLARRLSTLEVSCDDAIPWVRKNYEEIVRQGQRLTELAAQNQRLVEENDLLRRERQEEHERLRRELYRLEGRLDQSQQDRSRSPRGRHRLRRRQRSRSRSRESHWSDPDLELARSPRSRLDDDTA